MAGPLGSAQNMRSLFLVLLSVLLIGGAWSLSAPYKVVYINARDVNWNNPSAIVVSAIDAGYNVVIITLWRNSGAVDLARAWSQLPQSVQQSVRQHAHSKGAILLLSAGADETPYTSISGRAYGTAAARFALANNFDGVDFDMEGFQWGFKYGSASSAQCIQWLADASIAAKQTLGAGHYVTHAPQAPYFGRIGSSSPNPFPGSSGGYSAVYRAASSYIDFLNIQFYNQGTACAYNTYTTLFEQSGAGGVCGFAPGTSIKEIASYGIPLSKLVVGKYMETWDAANGYVTAAQLASFVKQAKQRLGWNAGVMCWQYSAAHSPGWIRTIYPATPPPPPPPPAADYVGCFVDQASPRALTGSTFTSSQMTIQQCQKFCGLRGYVYAGLQFGTQCYCGQTTGARAASNTQCNKPCAGNTATICGGTWRNSIYKSGFKGCYKDSAASRDLSVRVSISPTMTVSTCLNLCKSKNYAYAGLQYSTECWCGNTFGKYGQDAFQSCNSPCGGDRTEKCGSAYHNSIFAVGSAVSRAEAVQDHTPSSSLPVGAVVAIVACAVFAAVVVAGVAIYLVRARRNQAAAGSSNREHLLPQDMGQTN